MNNLASLLQDQGQLEEAAPLYRRALAACERTLGAEHPHTLTSVNNLASLLKAQGQLEEAAPLFRRALAARERTLGAEHPDTLVSMYNLASLLRKTGDLAQAETLARRSLQGYAARGLRSDVEDGVGQLGAILRAQGKADEAAALRAAYGTRSGRQ